MIETVGVAVSGAPFIVAGVTLLWLRWSAVWSGVATLAAAFAGAVLWPSLGVSDFAGAMVGGAETSVRVLFVLFGGLLLYNVLSVGGAVSEVSGFLGRVEPERVALAVVIVVGVGPFFESVTGFGVAVVISAPILLAAGFSPVESAALAMWSQCAVPWGALGIGTLIGADLSGLSFSALSDASAWLNLALFPVYAVVAVVFAGGREGVKRHGAEAVLLGFVAGVGTLLFSLFFVPELSGAGGGLLATLAFLFLSGRRARLGGVPVRALAPYGVLLAGITASTFISPGLGGETVVGLFVEGPGIPLLVATGFAAALFGVGTDGLGNSLAGTLKQWLPTAGSVVAFVLAGQVVAVSGAAETLARPAALSGALYPVAASVIGAAGGALTGSNAASNALFMPLQIEAARSLGGSEALIAAVQNVTGSHASMLAPQRVILAAAAVGMLGREGEVVKSALPPVVISVVLVAATALLF